MWQVYEDLDSMLAVQTVVQMYYYWPPALEETRLAPFKVGFAIRLLGDG